MTLVDTSVWIAHFQRGESRLVQLLEEGSVLTHPAVIGELACGNLSRRAQTLHDLRRLPSAPVANTEEVFLLIESRRLWGKGIGWTDAQLLSSTLITTCELWTLDRRLDHVARELKIAAY